MLCMAMQIKLSETCNTAPCTVGGGVGAPVSAVVGATVSALVGASVWIVVGTSVWTVVGAAVWTVEGAAFERVRTEEELVVSTDIGADRGAYWKNHVTFGGGAPLKVQVRVSSNPNSVSCTNDVMFRTWGTPAINERSKAVLCNNESSM